MKSKKQKKVLLAMSGGVDSSVAAVLLLEQGYEVAGVFMKLWEDKKGGAPLVYTRGRLHMFRQATPTEAPQGGAKAGQNFASTPQSLVDAKKVARKLGIKLHIIDFKKQFKKQIVDNFLNEYSKGRTPNPCVVCNKHIKFGQLLKFSKSRGFDYLATGHYVKKTRKQKNTKAKKQTNLPVPGYQLRIAKDTDKDQTYFLWTLTQSQLNRCLFPIGNYIKPEVREIAKKHKLPVHEKSDSQGICFIQDKRHYDFLRRHLKLKPGPIATLDGVKEKGIKPGSIIGQHQGLPLYTIGQRREILIGGIGPFYVVELEYKKNILCIANKFDKELLYKKELTAKNINWVSGEVPQFPIKCKARIRYLHPQVNCVVTRSGSKLRVSFTQKQRAITPGQSVVFYFKNEVLGGGVIE